MLKMIRRIRHMRRRPKRKGGNAINLPRRVNHMKSKHMLKKGDKVPILETAHKPPLRQGSYMDIDSSSHYVTLPSNTMLYHVSVYEKLTALRPQVTCFSLGPPIMSGHIYLAKNSKPLRVEVIGTNKKEARINLGEISSNDIEITYLGTLTGGNTYLVDEHGRTIHRYVKARFAPEYRILGEKLEAEDRDSYKYTMKKPGYKIVVKE